MNPDAKTLVIKLGSAIVGSFDNKQNNLLNIVDQIAKLFKMGHNVVLVTSGAVATGMKTLNISQRSSNIIDKQAFAAIGQGSLIHNYQIMFAKHDMVVAQLLLTRFGMEDRERYLNARNTLLKLLEWRILPIINENDSVAIEELGFGDNDELSALIAVKIGADFLILVTKTDGVYINMDDLNNNKENKVLKEIDLKDSKLESLMGDSVSECGRGGIKTKIKAAKMAARCGTTAMIINGLKPNTILDSFFDKCTGTLCAPSKTFSGLSSKKRWIALGISSSGKEIHIDHGASEAIIKKNSSLLASGIKRIVGEFKKGEIVKVISPSGVEIARGLVNYDFEELFKIQGRKSSDFTRILGYPRQEEVIHKDNMILTNEN